MKPEHSKLKTAPRPLFSCGFFRHCTQTVLSPTTTTPPALPFTASSADQPPPRPLPAPPPLPSSPPPPPRSSTLPGHATTKPESSSSSSSSNTSQSFTQWRFPIPNSPISHHLIHPYSSPHERSNGPGPNPSVESNSPPLPVTNLEETFHVAELRFSSGSNEDKFGALHLLEKSLVPNPRAAADGGDSVVFFPASLMKWLVGCLKEKDNGKSASKVLLARCLVKGNRHVSVEVGSVGVVVEAMSDLDGAVAERSLAALELLCTVAEGAAEVRAHALAVPMMVEVMGRMGRRGKEYGISVLAVIFSGPNEAVALPEEVARSVMLALKGNCSARGRRKGAQLLKILQEENGRLELTQDGS